MKVSLLQMKTLETPEENIVKIKEMLKEAKATGADMAVLPEMCCCPYENSAFVKYAMPYNSPFLTEIAKQTTAVKEDPLAGMSGLPILHTIARGIPVWMQLSVIGKAYGAMPVGLTNLGNLNCQSLALGDLIPVGGIFGGPLKKKPGMQISIISFDGECVLACYGRYTAEDEAHIQNMLDAMAKTIATYAESE